MKDSIHIKKAHEGIFTAKAKSAGMGVQEYASHVLANRGKYPADTVKQANFAKNFGNKKQLGGAVVRNTQTNPTTQELAERYAQGKTVVDPFNEFLSAPQKAATYALTGQYQSPSEALGINNKWGALATDLVLDPTNAVFFLRGNHLSKAAELAAESNYVEGTAINLTHPRDAAAFAAKGEKLNSLSNSMTVQSLYNSLVNPGQQKKQQGGNVVPFNGDNIYNGIDKNNTKKSVATIHAIGSKIQDQNQLATDISSQLDYMNSYVASPKYQERLHRNLNTELSLDPRALVNPDTIYSGEKRSTTNANIAKDIANRGRTSLNNTTIQVTDFDNGDGTIGQYYHPDNSILLADRGMVDPQYKTAAVHEMSHASSFGQQPYSTDFAKAKLSNIFRPADSAWNSYVQTPTEVKARLDALRFKLNQKGIYDARTQDFTPDMYKKMMADPDVRNEYNFKQLQDQFKGGDASGNKITWLLNNIADNQNSQDLNTDIPQAQMGGSIKYPSFTSVQDNTKVINKAIPANSSSKAIQESKQIVGGNYMASQGYDYYHPDVHRDYTSGDFLEDTLYKNQWLMDVPVVGDLIKSQAKKIAINSGGQSVVSNRDQKIKSGYTGQDNSDDAQTPNYKTANLVDQYFGDTNLPASKDKPSSDYLPFLPSVSIKSDFDKKNAGFDMTPIINSIRGDQNTDGDNFTKPSYKSYETGETAPLMNKLGIDLGGHKSGIGYDKDKNLPYVSISDAWDFSPKEYAKRYMGDESSPEYQRAYIQASLMQKAGQPFKVYDRFYFDPKTKAYIPDDKLPKQQYGGNISTQGYKSNSPDRNNDYNIIPSGQITMQDVPHPVYGVDDQGNEQMMYPGQDYDFPGNYVTEYPMKMKKKKDGGTAGVVPDFLDKVRNLKGFTVGTMQSMFNPALVTAQLGGQGYDDFQSQGITPFYDYGDFSTNPAAPIGTPPNALVNPSDPNKTSVNKYLSGSQLTNKMTDNLMGQFTDPGSFYNSLGYAQAGINTIQRPGKINRQRNWLETQQNSDNLFPVQSGGDRGNYVVNGSEYGQFRPNQMGAKSPDGMYNGMYYPSMAYGGQSGFGLDLSSDQSYTAGDTDGANPISKTIGPVDRDQANIEAEKGETVFGDFDNDGMNEHLNITGKKHSQGGTPLAVPSAAFIYSDTKKMKIGGDILTTFGKSEDTKKKYTPAQLAKQYDVNKYKAILDDKNADPIKKRTAEMMIENYNNKLGQLALVQEAKKGFPDGIPQVAQPYLMSLQQNTEQDQQNPQQQDQQQPDQQQQNSFAVGGTYDPFNDDPNGLYTDPYTGGKTKAGSTTPTGKQNPYNRNQAYMDKWESIIPGISNMDNGKAQALMYQYNLQNNPQSIKDMWNTYGLTAKGLKDPNTAKLANNGKFDPNNLTPDNLQKLQSAYSDGYFGVRQMDPVQPVIPSLPPGQPVTPPSFNPPDQLKPIPLAPPGLQPNSPSFKQGAPSPSGYWTQDKINMGYALENKANLNKYLPWAAPVTGVQADPTFYDPTRELANNNESANTEMMYANQFSGAQQASARNSSVSGNAAGNAANILGRYNNQNVGTANQFAEQNAGFMNQLTQQQAARANNLYQGTVIANQQFDNSKSQANNVIRQNVVGALNNKETTGWINSWYPQYNIDPGTGAISFTPGSGHSGVTQASAPPMNFVDTYQKLKAQYPGVADEVLREQAKYMTNPPSNTVSSDGTMKSTYKGPTPQELQQMLQGR